MTCPAYRDIPTGLFSSLRIVCHGTSGHRGPHKSAWITDERINEMFQTQAVQVAWKDKPPRP